MANPIDLVAFAKRAWEQAQSEYDKTSQPLARRGIPGSEDMTNQGILGMFSLPALANAVAPVGTYEDGSTGLAWPQLLAAPAEGMVNFGRYGYDSPEAIRDNAISAFDVAGGAVTGGLGVGLAGGLADNSVGIFGGRLARTADYSALLRAKNMAASNTPREQIWSDTGWFQGVDGRWRFEIDDSGATLPHNEIGKVYDGPINQLIDHPELMEAYPSIGKKDGRLKLDPSAQSATGIAYANGYTRATAANIRDARTTFLHELQHQVQGKEKTSYGSPGNFALDENAYAVHKRYAGEQEAYAVEKRADLSADERRARPPWLDYDVPEADQIVRFGGGGSSMSMADNAVRAVLPMDDAARMARAKGLGFDTENVWYHGSPHTFDEFEIGPNRVGTGGGDPYQPMSELGAFFTQDPEIAALYGPNVRQFYVRGEYPELYNPVANKSEAVDTIDQTVADMRQLLSRGYEGARLTGPGTEPELAVFNPRNIRSVDAAFDPAMSGSSNLLAANAPTGAAVPLASETQDQDPALIEFLRSMGLM